MQRFGLAGEELPSFTIGASVDEACEGMRRVLREKPKESLPTAFIADFDIIALGAMKGIKEEGYSIPNDFSIIGFDNRPECILANPPLTTLGLPWDYFGTAAVRQAINLVKEPGRPHVNTEIQLTLIEHNSVKDLNS